METATVVCIDPWEGNEGAHNVAAEESYGLDAFRRYTIDCPNITPLRAYSPDDIKWDRPIDCYYEDAVHTNPVLSRNLAFWTSFLRESGVVCGDDYRARFPDVRAGAHRLAEQLGRELLIVDFFWCLLPDAALVPRAARVAERLREIGREATAATAATPAVINVSPLVPPLTAVPIGQEQILKLRVTNDGGHDWPDRPTKPLLLRVCRKSAGAAPLVVAEVSLGTNRITVDEAVSVDVLIASTHLREELQVTCTLADHEADKRLAGFKHTFTPDRSAEALAPPKRLFDPRFRFGEGWAGREPGFRWSLGLRSTLVFDPVVGCGDDTIFLNLTIRPYIAGPVRTQRIIVMLNGWPCFAARCGGRVEVSLPVPPDGFTLDFVHPDAHRPSQSAIGNADGRLLAFAIERVGFSGGSPDLS